MERVPFINKFSDAIVGGACNGMRFKSRIEDEIIILYAPDETFCTYRSVADFSLDEAVEVKTDRYCWRSVCSGGVRLFFRAQIDLSFLDAFILLLDEHIITDVPINKKGETDG